MSDEESKDGKRASEDRSKLFSPASQIGNGRPVEGNNDRETKRQRKDPSNRDESLLRLENATSNAPLLSANAAAAAMRQANDQATSFLLQQQAAAMLGLQAGVGGGVFPNPAATMLMGQQLRANSAAQSLTRGGANDQQQQIAVALQQLWNPTNNGVNNPFLTQAAMGLAMQPQPQAQPSAVFNTSTNNANPMAALLAQSAAAATNPAMLLAIQNPALARQLGFPLGETTSGSLVGNVGGISTSAGVIAGAAGPVGHAEVQAMLHSVPSIGQPSSPAPVAGPTRPTDSTVGLTGRSPVALYISCDDDSLSEYQCLVRKHIELFEAQREDVESNAQGRNRPIIMGQVGIRCRHCTMLPPKHRARGAIYYPAKLHGIYQAAQNMASAHLCEHCQHVPPRTRNDLVKLRDRKSSAGGGKKYWADGVRVLGVYEDRDGLRFERG